MIVRQEKYVIATKDFPIQFNDDNGNLVNDIDDSSLNYEKSLALTDLNCYDEPDKFQILKVIVTYEF